jgi:hypothetical protein
MQSIAMLSCFKEIVVIRVLAVVRDKPNRGCSSQSYFVRLIIKIACFA